MSLAGHNGLIVDIDGPTADARYKELAGDEYEAWGEETTAAFTSGREGRRQKLWYVPASMVATDARQEDHSTWMATGTRLG